ncbi:MAG TPA: DUF1385 domain-containing protein [Candidatus Nanoarchaeia archaeon]|nr:DUF1385 domain-containing protein [Candidatus Nanoarchaeia archaeon]
MDGAKVNVGGQAIIEGVMIRGPSNYAIAVRKGSKILTKTAKIPKKKHSFLKWPFVRGFVNLAEMLVIGIKALMWSAEQAGDEKEKLSKKDLTITLFVSVGFAILFFIVLPYFLTNLIGFKESEKPVLFNVVDGIIRILIFLVYIVAISFMKDVKVLFQYHGAEHMAIHCYEHGKSLSVKNVKTFRTMHERCGTSFLFIVFAISVVVFSILPSIFLNYSPKFGSLNHWAKTGILFPVRILLIPLIAGIAYEILKLSDRKKHNLLFKMVSFPGIMLQKITTQKPTAKQIEVAIASLNKLLSIEKK